MNREIRSLTGIRGIAACWVVACHWSGDELSGLARDVALHGYVAVDLFMVLSGFVLAMTYADGGRGGYRYFVWQRFCRLYPLYAVTTLVCLTGDAWSGTGLFAPGGGPVLPALISNLLMTTTHVWEVDAIDGPSWSVSVEFTLNLFFPLFVLLCIRLSRRQSVAVAILCAAALILVSVLNHRLDGGAPGELGTLDVRLMYLRCGPEFALGMLCWRVWRQAPRAAVLGRTAWLAAIVAAMLAMTPFKALDLPFAAACCLLVTGLASERSVIARILGSRIPHWLGTISFSLYLWHAAFAPMRPALLAVLPLADPGVARMAANSVALAAVLAFSTLSFYYFEIPSRRWLRGRFAARPA